MVLIVVVVFTLRLIPERSDATIGTSEVLVDIVLAKSLVIKYRGITLEYADMVMVFHMR